ncbi:MAG: Ig-like domain-containing protein, partial [Candidatus Neomarinimicrobiota bacterium]
YNSSTPVTTSTTFQSNKNYYMEASGTVYYSNQNLMDAAYRLRGLNQDIDPPVPYDDNQNWPHDSGTSWTWNGQIPPRPIEDHYNDSHVYDYYFTGTNEPISVVFNDSGYGDNGGTLTFKFYEIESNRPPTTDDVNASIDENRNSFRLANISLVGNDPDGDNLTYSLVTTPQNGSYSIDGNILTYEPN